MWSKHFGINQSWIVLVPAIILAIVSLNLFSKLSKKINNTWLLLFLFALQGAGFVFIYLNQLGWIIAGTLLLMSGYFSLSTLVPMILNRGINKNQLGKGNGIMISFQYFGSFLGAAITGALWQLSVQYTFTFLITMVMAGIVLVLLQRKQFAFNT